MFIDELLSQAKSTFEDNIAMEYGELTISYADMSKQVDSVAAEVLEHVEPCDIVATVLPPSPELIISILAILKKGAVWLPLSPFGHEKENARKLAEARPSTILVLTSALQDIKRLLALADIDEYLERDIVSGVRLNANKSILANAIDLDAGYLFFTSGSTGRPKGIVGSLKGLQAFIRWESQLVAVKPDDRVSLLTPQTFDPFLRDVFLPLCSGAILCIPPLNEGVGDIVSLAKWLSRSAVTISHMVPSVCRLMLESKCWQSAHLFAPRIILFAGELLTAEFVKQIWQAPCFSRTRLINLYGTTESTLARCACEVQQKHLALPAIPVGTPMPDTRVHLVSADNQVLDSSDVGEIAFVGGQNSLGYFFAADDPLKPVETEITSKHGRCFAYKTGDIGKFDSSGQLIVLGRKDNQLKINGVRIELGEIEAYISRHPSIKQSVVVSNTNHLGDVLLTAFLVCNAPAPDKRQMYDFLSFLLSAEKIPSEYKVLEALPLNAHGKIDRLKLNELAQHTVKLAEVCAITGTQSSVFDWLITQVEQTLNSSKLDSRMSFTQLGGRSRQALQLLFAINEHFDASLALSEVMLATSLEELAQVIENNVSKAHALSDAAAHQQRLCFHQQLYPQSVAYNLTYVIPIYGEVDTFQLERSLQCLLAIEPSLRWVFTVNETGEFCRTTQDYSVVRNEIELQYFHLRRYQDPEKHFEMHLTSLANRPFQLNKVPPCRFFLFCLADKHYELVISLHHVLADEFSVRSLVKEWFNLYQQDEDIGEQRRDQQPSLILGDCQYELAQESLDYWHDHLAGHPSLSRFPTDGPSDDQDLAPNSSESFSLNKDQSEALTSFCAEQNISLSALSLAAFYLLMSKFSGQSDLTIGVPITQHKQKHAFGFAVNMLCCRQQLMANQRLVDFVEQVQTMQLKHLAHSHVPFDDVMNSLVIDRTSNKQPLFQTTFSFTVDDGVASENLPFQLGRLRYVENQHAKYDLTLQLTQTSQNIIGTLAFNTDMYAEQSISRIAQSYVELLLSMACCWQRTLADISALSSADKQQITAWNQTRASYSDNVGIIELIESTRCNSRQNIALEGDDNQLSFDQLFRRSEQLSQFLYQKGYRKGDHIAIALHSSTELVMCMAAVMRMGAVYVPVDPDYPADRRQFMISDSNAKCILTHSSLLFEPLENKPVIPVDKINLVGIQIDLTLSIPSPEPDDIAYIIYTSGSTGTPKGVEISHRGLCNLAEAEVDLLQVDAHSRVLQFASLSFDTSIWEILVTLLAGGTLVMANRRAMMPGLSLARLVAEKQITHLTLPASALAVMEQDSLPSVEVLVVAGEACSEALLKQWAVGRIFINSYGPTEATVSVTNAVLTADDTVHIGQPLNNMQCWVLDEHLLQLPIGAIGELCVSGVGLAKGYINKPEITDQRFVVSPEPYLAGKRLYRTGDLVRYRPDGNLEYKGRVDEQIKVRGFRVEPAEIEQKVRDYPEVKDSVVFAVLNDHGQASRLVAVVVSDGLQEEHEIPLRRHLEKMLPAYALPQDIIFLSKLPRLPNNKIDRAALTSMALNSIQNATPSSSALAPLVNGIQRLLGDIWQSLLGPRELHPDTSFFAIGGHSLMAVKVVAKLKVLGYRLDVGVFFDNPSLAYLASQCTPIEVNKVKAGTVNECVIEPMTPVALTAFQRGIWFECSNGENATYNIGLVISFSEGFNQERLIQALDDVCDANDIFSIQFGSDNGTPYQYKAPVAHYTDFSYLDRSVSAESVFAFVKQRVEKPIMLGKQAPIESTLFKDNQGRFYLAVVVQHILIDEASVDIWISQLVERHDDIQRVASNELPKGDSFLDFAAQQNPVADQDSVNYWRTLLMQCDRKLTLPFTTSDNPNISDQSGAECHLVLEAETAQGFCDIAKAHKVTPMLAWLVAFSDFIQHFCNQKDLCIGVPVIDRPGSLSEWAMGPYLNTLVFKTQRDIKAPYEDKLKQGAAQWRSSLRHAHIPFATISDASCQNDDDVKATLFKVMFVYKQPSTSERVSTQVINGSTAKFPLTFFVSANSEGNTNLWLEYQTHLFSQSDMESMLDAFASHVRSIIETRASTSRLPIDLIESRAKSSAAPIAVCYAHESLTFAQLNALANAYALKLKQNLNDELRPVAILLPRGIPLIASVLACMKLNLPWIPLDVKWPESRIDYIVADANVAMIMTDSNRSLGGETPFIHVEDIVTTDECPDNVRMAPSATLEDPCYIIYTSGSTGKPKGVVVNNAGLQHYCRYACDAYSHVGQGTTTLHLSPAFDASITSIFVPLMCGGTQHIIGEEQEIEDLSQWLNTATVFDFVKLTPAHLDLLCEAQHIDNQYFAGLFVVGGDALPSQLVKRVHQVFPKATIINEYGPTEAVVGCCVHRVSRDIDYNNAIPIGKAIERISLFVVNRDKQLAADDEPGELFIGGEFLAVAYLNKPDLTAEKFIDAATIDPSLSGRCYATGDLVVRDTEQVFTFLGRIDRQIKHRGFRIELAEIEHVLGGLEGVLSCAVIYTDSHLIQGFVTLTAPEMNLDIISALSERLPEYMVPTSITVLDVMPLTTNGKIDTKALSDRCNALPKNLEICTESTEVSGCSDELEHMLLNEWQQLLGCQSVSLNTHYQALGGDSIFCLRLLFRLRKQQIDLELEAILRHSTIGSLAQHIRDENLLQSRQGFLASEAYSGEVTITPIQQWLFAHQGSGHNLFNQSCAFALTRNVNINTLEQAVTYTVNKHAGLRQGFRQSSNGDWSSWVAAPVERCSAKIVRVKAHSANEEEAWINQYLAEQDQSFNLSEPPLIKYWVFQTRFSRHHFVVFAVHHLVIDALSWSYILQDINQAYSDFPHLQTNAFDNSFIKFAQIASDNNSQACKQSVSSQYGVADTIVAPELLRGDQNTYAKAAYLIQPLTSQRAAHQFNKVVIPAGVHNDEFLLTALALAVQEWCGRQTFSIDIETNGRNGVDEADNTTTVGWMTSFLGVQFDLASHSAIDSLLSVMQQCRQTALMPSENGPAQLCFNFLGSAFDNVCMQHDVIGARTSAISLPRHSASLCRPYALELDVWMDGQALQMQWTYSQHIYDDSDIRELSNCFDHALDRLLEDIVSVGYPLLVPADLHPACGMTQTDINRLSEQYPDIEAILPATPVQQGMAFHTWSDDTSPIYHEQIVFSLTQPVEMDQVRRIWADIVARYPMLRARILNGYGASILLTVHRQSSADCRFFPANSMSVEALLEHDRRTLFDLSSAPLIRISLITEGCTVQKLLLTHHHAILDGWSVALLVNELNAELTQLATPTKVSTNLANLDVLRAFNHSAIDNAAPDHTFWKDICATSVNNESMVFIRPQRGIQAFDESTDCVAQLNGESWSKCRDTAVALGVSTSTLVNAAWALVLNRFRATQEGTRVQWGITLSGRTVNVSDIATLVGLCINTLPLSVEIDRHASCVEWLRSLQNSIYALQKHCQTSLVELQRVYSDNQSMFDSIVVVTNYENQYEGQTPSLLQYSTSKEATNYPLTLVVTESPETLQCRLSGHNHIVDPVWLTPLLTQLMSFIQSLCALNTTSLGNVIDNTQDTLDSRTLSGTMTQDNRPELVALFRQHSVNNAQAVALVDATGEMTFHEVQRSIDCLWANMSAYLTQHLDDQYGQPVVAVHCERSRELFISVLACLNSNATFLLLEPELPEARLRYLIEDAKCNMILSDDPKRLAGINNVVSVSDMLKRHTSMNNPYQQKRWEGKLAYLMYTSGSTGQPKGACLSSTNLRNYLAFAHRNYAKDSMLGACMHGSVSFDGTLTSLLLPAMTGGTLHMLNQPDGISEIISVLERAVSPLMVKLTPTHLRAFILEAKGRVFTQLHTLIIGGEALDYQHLEGIFELAPLVRVINEYGPTEATVGCCIFDVTPQSPTIGPVPIGQPIDNTVLTVRTPAGQRCQVGEVGELCIAGDSVALGYHGLPLLTQRSFIDSHDGRYYRTGDTVYSDPDGVLHYLGRIDEQLKINGVRIEPGEAESAIKSLITCQNVAVVCHQILSNKLVAFVESAAAHVNEAELRQKLASLLPIYLVPYRIVAIEQLPVTTNGKIDRQSLSKMELAQADPVRVSVAATTASQHLLHELVSDILGIQTVSICDDFFALGGHSLSAMKLISRIAQRTGVVISIRSLFNYSRLDALAEFLDTQLSRADGTSTTKIPALKRVPRHTG